MARLKGHFHVSVRMEGRALCGPEHFEDIRFIYRYSSSTWPPFDGLLRTVVGVCTKLADAWHRGFRTKVSHAMSVDDPVL